MSTSGLYSFDPKIAEHIDEAWERVGKDPSKISAKELISARRSMNYMLTDWQTIGPTLWTVKEVTIKLTQATETMRLDSHLISIMDAYLRRDSVDIPMASMARDEYSAIVNKSEQGRPDRYYLDRTTPPSITFWQVPENSTDEFIYWGLFRTHSVTELFQEPDIPYRYYEAFAAGLAARLAEKFDPEREAALFAKASNKLEQARQADREIIDTQMLPKSRRRRGKW